MSRKLSWNLLQGMLRHRHVCLFNAEYVNTLLLNRQEVQQVLDPQAALPALRAAFAAHSCSRQLPAQRHRSDLPVPGTATVLFPGTAEAIPAYSVKVHAKFPDQTPAIRGALLLFDSQTGALLAIMDSTYLTAARTGLASALGADLLARPDASTVAVVGAGAQGRFQLTYLHALRPIERVRVFDTLEEKAATFSRHMTAHLGCPVEAANTLSAAVEGADIILTATWAREPFLHAEGIDAGVHISTLGADEPGKAEISADLIRRSVFVCDDRELALHMGAVGNVGLEVDVIDAELGEVIAGEHPGRRDRDDITVFASVGLPFQDVVVAWQVYQEAVRRGIGQPYAFLP